MGKRRKKNSSNFGRRVRRGKYGYSKMQKKDHNHPSSTGDDKDNNSCSNNSNENVATKKSSSSPPQLIEQIQTTTNASRRVIHTSHTNKTNQTLPVARNDGRTKELVNKIDDMLIEEENNMLFHTYRNQDPVMRTSIAYYFRHVLKAPPASE